MNDEITFTELILMLKENPGITIENYDVFDVPTQFMDPVEFDFFVYNDLGIRSGEIKNCRFYPKKNIN